VRSAHNTIDYELTPAICLSQAIGTFDITIADVVAAFRTQSAKYKTRTITVADPGVGLTQQYFVTIADPNYYGDPIASSLIAYAETTPDKVGLRGYTYLGAIDVTHDGGTTTVQAGGGFSAQQIRYGQ